MTDGDTAYTAEESDSRTQVLLALLDHGRSLVEAWAQALNDDERSAAGAFERWSASETLAHIGHWHEQLALALDLRAAGEPVPALWQDTDEENRRFFEQQRGISWGEAWARAQLSYEALRAQVGRLDRAALEGPDDFAWCEGTPLWRTIVGNGYRHPGAHIAQYWSQRGDSDRAIAIFEEMVAVTARLDFSPEERGGDLYNLACAHMDAGRPDAALRYLRQALALAPDLAGWAREDPDLTPLHGGPDFESLVRSAAS